MEQLKEVKLVFAVAGVFLSILPISYRNSQIDEAFTKNEERKQAYLAVEKENDQMKVDIENSLNYNNVEQQAKELLGMQTLSTKQTVYVNLPKKDYIQPATETVVIDKNENDRAKRLYNKFFFVTFFKILILGYLPVLLFFFCLFNMIIKWII